MNAIQKIGLPQEFGVVLLVLALIVTLAPYAGAVDFGIFRIPRFPPQQRKRFVVGGPAALLIAIGLFVPWWATTEESAQVWKVAWAQINQPLPSYGDSQGVRATNRQRFVLLLDPLTDMKLDGLETSARELVALLKMAPSRSDPFYDLQLTPDIDARFQKLRQDIRLKAVASGVVVQ